MSTAPYYQGDTVKLVFQISDKNGPIIPTSVDFAVVDESDYIYLEAQAIVQENEVTAVIPGYETKSPGIFAVIYTIHLPDGGTRSHKQTYRILPKGPIVSEEFDGAFPVTPSSAPNEILSAKGNAIRTLRQLGKSAEETAAAVSALVEKTTGRRLPL